MLASVAGHDAMVDRLIDLGANTNIVVGEAVNIKL